MKITTEFTVAAVGLGVLAYVLYRSVPKLANAAGGLVSGNNVITQSATDASGNPVTAYQGAGVLGTLGAATNAASGGLFASVGQWFGGTIFDLTHPASNDGTSTQDIDATLRLRSAADKYNRPPVTNGDPYDARLYRTENRTDTPSSVGPGEPTNYFGIGQGQSLPFGTYG